MRSYIVKFTIRSTAVAKQCINALYIMTVSQLGNSSLVSILA